MSSNAQSCGRNCANNIRGTNTLVAWFSTNFPAVSKLTESSQLPVKWPLRRGCISRDDKNRISFLGVFTVSSFNSLIALALSDDEEIFSTDLFLCFSFFLSFSYHELLFNSIISARLKILFSFLFSFYIVISCIPNYLDTMIEEKKENNGTSDWKHRSITFN